MKTTELIAAANGLSDETETNVTVLEFLNDAMALINEAANAGFPYLNLTETTNAPLIPEKWQRMLLIPFAVGRIKQKDSSQFEYSDAYSEFKDNLVTFKHKYNVPTIYKSLVSGETIFLADDTTYEVQEDDTLQSIATDKSMTTADLLAANETLYYVKDGIDSDVYDKAAFPWFQAW